MQSITMIIDGQKRSFSLRKGPNHSPKVKITGTEEIKVTIPGAEDISEKEVEPDDEEEEEEEMESYSTERELPAASRLWMKKYEELFAKDDNGDDLEVRYVSDDGDDINPEAAGAIKVEY